MIKQVANLGWDAVSAVRRGVGRGLLQQLGAESVKRNKDGSEIIRWMGKGWQIGNGAAPSRYADADTAMNTMSWFMQLGQAGVMAGGSGFMLHQAYQENGMGGVIQTAGWEIAAGAALATHGYKWQNGVAQTGGMFRRGGFINHAGRGIIGSSLGYAVGTSIGGPLGAVAGGMAAYGGVVAGGPLMAASAVGLGVAGIGYGTTQVLKMGHAFHQRQKDVHTSGDLAAFNTRGAFTMRQRAVQAMHKSHLNARSALGREANFMHYPSKNYHSRYRM